MLGHSAKKMYREQGPEQDSKVVRKRAHFGYKSCNYKGWSIFLVQRQYLFTIIWISEFKIAAGSPALWPYVLATFHPRDRKCHAKIEVVSYQTIKQPKNVLNGFLEKWVDEGLEISSVLQKLKRRILVHREHATNSFTRLFKGETCKFALDKLLRYRLCVSASVIKI